MSAAKNISTRQVVNKQQPTRRIQGGQSRRKLPQFNCTAIRVMSLGFESLSHRAPSRRLTLSTSQRDTRCNKTFSQWQFMNCPYISEPGNERSKNICHQIFPFFSLFEIIENNLICNNTVVYYNY
jgi:hypothetical protein